MYCNSIVDAIRLRLARKSLWRSEHCELRIRIKELSGIREATLPISQTRKQHQFRSAPQKFICVLESTLIRAVVLRVIVCQKSHFALTEI